MKTLPSENKPSQTRGQTYGFFLILLAALNFSVMALGIRIARESFRADTLVFYRNAFQTLILLPWWRHFFPVFERKAIVGQFRTHIIRSGAGVVSMYFFFVALKYLPLAMTTLIGMTSVVWGALVAWHLMKERPTQRELVSGALILGGIALTLIVTGEGDWSARLHPAGVLSAFLYGFATGVALASLRKLRKTAGSGEIVFFFGLIGTIAMVPFVAVSPEYPTTGSQWGWLALIVVTGAGAQLLMSEGFRYATTFVGQLAVIQQVTFNIVLGLVFLNEIPPPVFYVATVLVVGGVLGLVWKRSYFRVITRKS